MNPNTVSAFACLQALVEHGVRHFCLCPGARNAPLIALLTDSFFQSYPGQHFEVISFFDERAAGFFALGKARAQNRPVAVITTSGTAVGELLPSVMEAYYSGIPLVVVSADRPRSYRGTGAPQTAEQQGIFGVYTPFQLDIEVDEVEAKLAHLNSEVFHQPVHLNLCFHEPLLEPPGRMEGSITSLSRGRSTSDRPVSPGVTLLSSSSGGEWTSSAEAFFQATSFPLVLVSSVHPSDRNGVLEFLKTWGAPVYLEATSGIQEACDAQGLRIACGDRIFERAHEAGYPVDGVLRLGGVPTLRFWRDLESKFAHLPVLSLSRVPFSGLSRPSQWVVGDLKSIVLKLKDKVSSITPFQRVRAEPFFQKDQVVRSALRNLSERYPDSEPALVHALSSLMKKRAFSQKRPLRLYLGNSLPIRQWDLISACSPWTSQTPGVDLESSTGQRQEIWASRGLNGIDGQISTFLGYADADSSNWALVGDLTALYDLQGPWVLPQLGEQLEAHLVVINNGGGQIFSRMFSDPRFQNAHRLSFEAVAELWSMAYWKVQESSVLLAPEAQAFQRPWSLIELSPCESSTQQFWDSYEAASRL
ncbi:MAG: 2-succinyl-5-enolpyruvyl-6-hydroxy-3-cyclohexene-1-carboxylic-acid synthase [Bdellovibrionia bacterium]